MASYVAIFLLVNGLFWRLFALFVITVHVLIALNNNIKEYEQPFDIEARPRAPLASLAPGFVPIDPFISPSVDRE